MIKLPQYGKSTRLLSFGIFGIILATSGYLMHIFEPLDYVCNSMAILSPNSLMYKLWTKPPYDVWLKVYIFNVTNADEFLKNNDKMKVEELGPYVYKEIMHNNNGVFNSNGTLTFEPKRYLEFQRDKSVGDPKVDRIISPNIPLLGITSSLKDASFFTNIALAQIANVLDSKSILNLTIDEYLWGYDDRLVELANKALPNWINFPRFGIMDRLMALDNASNIVNIKTNDEILSNNPILTDEEKSWRYSITTFNGSPGLSQWGYKDGNETYETNTKCNTVEGSFVEGIFPNNLNENSTFRLYRRAFCRPVDFRYDGTGIQAGIETLNWRVKEHFLSTPEENPDNACYCLNGKCPKKGLGSIAPCYYGIPVVLSQPHFFNAHPSLTDEIDGMSPDREAHDTTFQTHPKLGVPLGAKLRIQINLDVDTKYSTRCAPFNGLTLPLFWLELNIEEVPSIVKILIVLLDDVAPIAQVVLTWTFILFGTAMVAVAALFLFYAPANYGLEDPYDNRIGYSPIRIIPMNQYLNPPTIRITK